MTLPRRPELSDPIPNPAVTSGSTEYALKGPYWDISVGNGLEVNNEGHLQVEGAEPLTPEYYLYGTNGFLGLGNGLELGTDGSLQVSD